MTTWPEDAPDELRDVLVYFVAERDGATRHFSDRWHVFLGHVKMITLDDEQDAIAHACRAAMLNRRPAWLFGRTGHTVQKIDLL
jgi:hypothetical protein